MEADVCSVLVMEVDIFLLIFVLCVIALSLFANVRILQYYQDPNDKGFAKSILVKVVIVISLTICWLLNILLPIDVRNSRPKPGFLDMRIMWMMAFITLAIFLVGIIPAAMFYHEASDDVAIGKHKKKHVMCNMFFMLLFVIGALAISYAFLAHAAMPVQEYSCPVSNWVDASQPLSRVQVSEKVCGSAEQKHIEFKVGFQIYMVAFMCFIGWFFFVTFGGIGLSALPLDLIIAWIDRPRHMTSAVYATEKREIGVEATDLLRRAEKLHEDNNKLTMETGWSARRKQRALVADYNKWKKEVIFLEEDFQKMEVARHDQTGAGFTVFLLKLISGIIFAIVSIMWILHIIIYVLVAQQVPGMSSPFLNDFFAAFEGPGLYPIGVGLFGAFNLYLLMCVVKGTLKFGMRIFIFFSIHPMQAKATPLNSILFNVLIMLITSATVVQFSQQAFADYARLTDADVIFSAQIKYLTFYGFFFENNIFIYTLLGWFVLTIIYLFVCGARDNDRKRRKNMKKRDKKGKKEKKGAKERGRAPEKVGKRPSQADNVPLNRN